MTKVNICYFGDDEEPKKYLRKKGWIIQKTSTLAVLCEDSSWSMLYSGWSNWAKFFETKQDAKDFCDKEDLWVAGEPTPFKMIPMLEFDEKEVEFIYQSGGYAFLEYSKDWNIICTYGIWFNEHRLIEDWDGAETPPSKPIINWLTEHGFDCSQIVDKNDKE